MKNLLSTIILVACAASVFTSCQKDNSKGKLDPSAKVYISPAPGVKGADQVFNKAYGDQKILTAHEIVLQTQRLMPNGLDIDDWNKDSVNDRFICGSTWVVNMFGELSDVMITSRDMIFVTVNEENRAKDTIAYIPNKVMIEAEKAITAAYNAGDYVTCYRLFEEAFTFIPTTGKQWGELKSKGEN